VNLFFVLASNASVVLTPSTSLLGSAQNLHFTHGRLEDLPYWSLLVWFPRNNKFDHIVSLSSLNDTLVNMSFSRACSGASYCDIGHLSPLKKPNANNPLDIKFPGICWTEDGKPNWVGHLITKHYPHPRFDPSKAEQSKEYLDNPLLVYNYARGGEMVDGVGRQINQYFLPGVGQKPDWAPWTSENTLFGWFLLSTMFDSVFN
jgi:hypothetical protein